MGLLHLDERQGLKYIPEVFQKRELTIAEILELRKDAAQKRKDAETHVIQIERSGLQFKIDPADLNDWDRVLVKKDISYILFPVLAAN